MLMKLDSSGKNNDKNHIIKDKILIQLCEKLKNILKF